jgi:uncharacterized integral membrane protein
MVWYQPDGYYVEIPDGKRIKFPDRCVVCNRYSKNTTVQIHGNPVGYYGLWIWQFRMGRKVEVPAHKNCGAELKSSVFSRTLLLLFLAIIALALAIHFDWSKWTMVGVLLLFLLIPVLWQMKNAPPVEFEFANGVYEFRFSNLDYANEFAELNDVEVQ